MHPKLREWPTEGRQQIYIMRHESEAIRQHIRDGLSALTLPVYTDGPRVYFI